MALNINGTTGISGVDGSASAPALQGTDSNTGINFASDTVNINTGGQTRATVDSSGNMLIGATSASGKLHVEDSGELNSYFIGNTSTLGARLILQNKNATANSYNAIEGTDSGGQSTSIIKFYNADNANNEGFLTFETRPSAGLATERMRIESDGDLRVQRIYDNTTSGGANVRVQSNGLLQRDTSSKRYKNTITDATHGLADLNKLRSVTYKGNNDGDTIFGGLIAEEVHDAGLTEFVDYDSDNQPDALKYGNMVSLCIKAIQELSTKVETLETEKTQMQTDLTALTARVAALEAG